MAAIALGSVRIGVSLLAALHLLGCSDQQSEPVPEQVVQAETSRFTTLDLEIGMNREQVEEKVAVLLGTQNTYFHIRKQPERWNRPVPRWRLGS